MENVNENLTSEVPAEIPRRIAGLVSGRILNFVLASGSIRPLLVVNPLDGFGPVNGVLFFDPATDSPETLGVPLLPNKYGHAPTFCVPVTGVPFDELGITPATWHWPQGVMLRYPVAASVDPAALSTQVEAILAPVIDAINEKLELHLKATSDLLELEDGKENPSPKDPAQWRESANFGNTPASGVAGLSPAPPVSSVPDEIKFVQNPVEVVSDAVGGADVLVPEVGVSLDPEQATSVPTPEPESSENAKAGS